MRAEWLAVALVMATQAASAQLATPDPDWKELDAPAPPPVRLDDLIPLDMPSSSLRMGVDPKSVSVGADGIVRYVVIGTGPSGAVNAIYEGLRCNTAEVKVYARHNPASGWVPAKGAEWQRMHEVRNSRHSLLIARNGACSGQAPNRDSAQIVRDLRSGPDLKFVN